MPEVELPLNLPVPASSSSPAFTSSGGGASILVIDDESAIRESLEVLLMLEGYQVRMAIDGEEGLRTLEQETSTSCSSTWPFPAKAAWSCCRRSKTAILSCQSS
jgi:PleD family two-component response regulator